MRPGDPKTISKTHTHTQSKLTNQRLPKSIVQKRGDQTKIVLDP